VSFDIDTFPYSNQLVPRPDDLAAVEYSDDTGSEEEEHVAVDGEGREISDESSSEEDSDSDSEQDTLARYLRNPQSAGVQEERAVPAQPEAPAVPDPLGWDAPDDQVGQQDAWEIVEILGERSRKKGKRKVKQYKVQWKGDYPPEWLHYSKVRAPELIAAWEAKNNQPEAQVELVATVYHQLSSEVERVPVTVAEEEESPFKHLFDIKQRARPKPPVGYKNMLKHEFAEYFQQASIKEKLQNLHWKAYEEVPIKDVPRGTKILRPMTAYDIKYNTRGEIEKFKSRVCLDGSRTTVPEDETYETIANFGTIRMLLCLANRYGMDIVQTDVKNFFLQARMPPGKEYYAYIPDGWAENDPNTHVAKVLAPWYGLKESAKIAGDQLADIFANVGLKESVMMPKVFYKWIGDDLIIGATHIDDAIWITTNMKLLKQLLDEVDKSFELTRTYNPTKLLGIEIEYDKKRGLMKLHQGSYIRAKLKELGVVAVNRKTNSPGFIAPKVDNPVWSGSTTVQASPEAIRRYQKRVGIQMWALQSDPSSMYVVHKLAEGMLNPQWEHEKGIDRVEQYKATYPEVGVVFKRHPHKEKMRYGLNMDCLTYYADADLAGCRTTSKSVSGYCVYMGESGMFDWKSKKQTCVCQSSCESEVFANKECTCHAVWLRQALSEIGFTFTQPTPVCQDNIGAISLCKSDKHHTRVRHFRMHVHLLKDCARRRITIYPWVPTRQMRGDLFNKAHGPDMHQKLCVLNGIHTVGVEHIFPEAEPLEIFGWPERVAREREEKRAAEAALEKKVCNNKT